MESAFEIIGPPMIGPSSSHTAGAVRMGLVARRLLGCPPVSAGIGLHGSFAATGKGHATDRALVAGLLGMNADDSRISSALEIAPSQGLLATFEKVDLGEGIHPNSARLSLVGVDESRVDIIGSSVGGGEIEIVNLDGFSILMKGMFETLVFWHDDRPGFLAHVTAVLAIVNANIATIRTTRLHRAADALTVVEIDGQIPHEAVELMRLISHAKKMRLIERLK